MATALAATVHDPGGRLAPAIVHNAALLRELFAGIAINASDATHADALAAAREHLDASTMIHAQGEAIIGRARRDAVRLALDLPGPAILYSDFDHLIRWVEGNAAELRTTLVAEPQTEFLVVGRSTKSFATEPQRLQDTERLVNRAYALMTGRDWDLMFAVRRLSRRAAQTIVRDAREDSVANDVEWPLLAERAGLSLGYVAADGLYYRTMEEFGTPSDTGDGSAHEWLRRIEIAAQHAAVLRRYLNR